MERLERMLDRKVSEIVLRKTVIDDELPAYSTDLTEIWNAIKHTTLNCWEMKTLPNGSHRAKAMYKGEWFIAEADSLSEAMCMVAVTAYLKGEIQ